MTDQLVVVEILRGPGSSWGAVRDWAAGAVRAGDALATEGTRMFFVLTAVGPNLVKVLERLQTSAGDLGVSLDVRDPSTDDVVGSIHRRAQAGIVPVTKRLT